MGPGFTQPQHASRCTLRTCRPEVEVSRCGQGVETTGFTAALMAAAAPLPNRQPYPLLLLTCPSTPDQHQPLTGLDLCGVHGALLHTAPTCLPLHTEGLSTCGRGYPLMSRC
jgi:hypothetical protein